MTGRLLVSLLLILILFTSISITTLSNQYSQVGNAFAASPSFVRQEIVSASNDWILWREHSDSSFIRTHDGHLIQLENAKNMSQCKIGDKFLSPSIESVSYISNGKTLNATVWLNSNFEEPPLKDTIEIYPKQLEITAFKLTKTFYSTSSSIKPLEKYAASKIDQLKGDLYNPLNNYRNVTFDQQKSNLTTISGHEAYKVVYDAVNSQGIDFKNMTLWTINGAKAYDITYSAIRANYSANLPSIQNMINSIKFQNSSADNKPKAIDLNNVQYGNISEFKGLGIKIDYPMYWKNVKETENNGIGGVTFRAPFEDEGLATPSWHETTYTMAIAIDSPQHAAVTDYRVILSRNSNSNNNTSSAPGTWIRQIFEVSAYDKSRLLEQEKNYTGFHDKDNPYILFYIDLDKMNFPQQYKAIFYITDEFTKEHRYCRLIDITNWIVIPPPEYTISITPNSSIVLRAGEEKNVEVVTKGNTHLASEAFLTVYNNNTNKNSNNKDDIILNFIPNKVSILPSGAGVSTLHIKASDSAKALSYTIPIVANISFPNMITNRGGETFSNSKRESLSQISNLSLTVLPPYTTEERFHNFVNTWITPITGVWPFLAGVGAIVAPLAIRLYRKKKQQKKNHLNEKEKTS